MAASAVKSLGCYVDLIALSFYSTPTGLNLALMICPGCILSLTMDDLSSAYRRMPPYHAVEALLVGNASVLGFF